MLIGKLKTRFAAAAAVIMAAVSSPATAIELGQTRPTAIAFRELARDNWKPIAMGVGVTPGLQGEPIPAYTVLMQQGNSDKWRIIKLERSTTTVMLEGDKLAVLKAVTPGIPVSFSPQDWDSLPRFQLVQQGPASSCGPMKQIFSQLRQGREEPIVYGATRDAEKIMTLTASETQQPAWTLVLTDKEGTSCMVAGGVPFSFAKGWTPDNIVHAGKPGAKIH